MNDRSNYPNDSGSAARFFAACPNTAPEDHATRLLYCPKANRQDRDEGCEGLPKHECGMMDDDAYDWRDDIANGRSTKKPLGRNHHPTVKPTALMRWLCKLITPPGGTILDPFMGSGSTGKAAVVDGFGFVGVEREAEYMAIAHRRIEHELAQRDGRGPLLETAAAGPMGAGEGATP